MGVRSAVKRTLPHTDRCQHFERTTPERADGPGIACRILHGDRLPRSRTTPHAYQPPLGPVILPAPDRPRGEAVQRVVKVRPDYNSWVARETMEDYALRFTLRSFRKWSELLVANTAFGATLLAQYGFINAF